MFLMKFYNVVDARSSSSSSTGQEFVTDPIDSLTPSIQVYPPSLVGDLLGTSAVISHLINLCPSWSFDGGGVA